MIKGRSRVDLDEKIARVGNRMHSAEGGAGKRKTSAAWVGSENDRARVLRVVIERPCVKKNARKYDRWQGHSGGVDPHLRHLAVARPRYWVQNP